jgi:Leucine-rich repeat (LRR) protein
VVLLISVYLNCLVASEPSENKVDCEEIKDKFWSFIGNVKSCFMRDKTSIAYDDSVIDSPRNETIRALTFEQNWNIFYLPVEIAEVFPNLEAYSAWDCSLETVSNKNFKNLTRLMVLNLSNNKIATIEMDTFEDLAGLRELHLSKIFWHKLR